MPSRRNQYTNTHTGDPQSERYGVVVHKQGPGGRVTKLTCAEPLDALVMALDYLRNGYHVLLTEATVEALRDGEQSLALERLGARYQVARV